MEIRKTNIKCPNCGSELYKKGNTGRYFCKNSKCTIIELRVNGRMANKLFKKQQNIVCNKLLLACI
ncbi:MAG: hypothetical protein NWF09_07480 [Candidatus Bathyarchaeota archaeon]|nr:hypothetical protein [Candidatus Bathyarchaeota archaeon]